MDRIGRNWTPEEERIAGETATSAREFGVGHHSASRGGFVVNSTSSRIGSHAADDNPPGISRFIFATGVDTPKEVEIYAKSIREAKASARKLYPAAELRRIQHIVD